MDVKEAVGQAKRYVKDVFEAGSIRNVGLEENKFDETEHAWNTTIGFSRPWKHHDKLTRMYSQELKLPAQTYKVFRIDNDIGSVVSVEHRDIPASN